jgi:hypothetical protein
MTKAGAFRAKRMPVRAKKTRQIKGWSLVLIQSIEKAGGREDRHAFRPG